MQPGCEHRRSASKRVLRRGSAEIRAPWIGPPTMANGPLPLESHARTDTGRYVRGIQPRLALLYFWDRSGRRFGSRAPDPRRLGADRVDTREGRLTSGARGTGAYVDRIQHLVLRAGGGNRTLDHSLTKRMLCR